MTTLVSRLGTVLILSALAGCGVDAPSSQTAAASKKPVQESMEGATCALAATDENLNKWQRNYELTKCLRELAYEDWAQAKAEAAHIAGWSIEHISLNEITDILARYESSEALHKDLDGRGLLDGPGAEYFEEDTGEGWQPITVNDHLRKSGYWYEFDAETGTYPNNHDYLLESLAALFGEPLAEAKFVEIAPDDWGKRRSVPAACHIRRTQLGNRSGKLRRLVRRTDRVGHVKRHGR